MNNTNKIKRNKSMLISLIMIIVSILLVFFGLLWQKSLSILAFCNAFYLSTALLFFYGWIVLMVNMNVLSPLLYGIKSFFLLFVGKKPKKDYYTYLTDIKENPISKKFIIIPIITSLIHLIIAVILSIIVY